MLSNYETFWTCQSFAVVGHNAKKSFPKLTYRGLKRLGKTVFAVDGSVEEVEGDKAYSDLSALPEPVDAVVLELPKAETKEWVEKVAVAGAKNLWLHMGTETPEAVKLAEERGLNLRKGTCAVMYVTPQFSYHSIHRGIMKLIGKY